MGWGELRDELAEGWVQGGGDEEGAQSGIMPRERSGKNKDPGWAGAPPPRGDGAVLVGGPNKSGPGGGWVLEGTRRWWVGTRLPAGPAGVAASRRGDGRAQVAAPSDLTAP